MFIFVLKTYIYICVYKSYFDRGTGSNQYFYNWNGDISPVVHQFDRFQSIEFKGQFENYLGALQGLY
jgi:hypothetical protein